jgi:hypothetical protein
MEHSATNCLLQLYTQVFWYYIGGILYDLVDILQQFLISLLGFR